MICHEDYCELEPAKKAFDSIKEYQEKAMAANDSKDSYRLGDSFRESIDLGVDVPELINGLLGLSGESGELIEVFKKWIFQGSGLDVEHAKRELGDVMWYVVLVCHAMKWDLADILEINLEKISKRYPSGFDVEKANLERSKDE